MATNLFINLILKWRYCLWCSKSIYN